LLCWLPTPCETALRLSFVALRRQPTPTFVERIARTALNGGEVRVLKLKHPPEISAHVCNVLLAVVGAIDDFLPVFVH
jgi:hypothetical protein